ncbi:MAG: Nif3-like dinuclear metal center hexameric protein [Isosphaeraceae bacterium]
MTTTVSEVTGWLEQFAPANLAESWDNVGLLWGDPAAEVRRVMTCLTVTRETAAEAIQEQASLIVSHHPVLFHAVKRIRADLAETGHLWKLARAGIAIASPHTAFDNTQNGINDLLCRRLGLLEIAPLRPNAARGTTSVGSSAARSFKIVVFTPESDREAVMSAAFEAGAGQIGAYRECSFAIPGQGTFFGTDASNPAVGEKGRRETVGEMRLEVVCPEDQLADVLASIRARHSYEEPAIDVYPLHEIPPEREKTGVTGAGRIGRFVEPRSLAEFAAFVGRALGRVAVLMVGDPNRRIYRVAIACGAGDDFLKDAARAGADVLLTGEARFHGGLEAEALGIALITAGHYVTERLGVEDLARRIAIEYPTLTVWPSQSERDPFRFISAGTNETSLPMTKAKP